MQNEKIKILIVDDHALFREGLSYVLNELENELSVLEAADYNLAFQHAADHKDLDLILLDLNLPGKDGFTILDMFTRQYPALPIVIISASKQRSDIQRALDAGAVGYIPKDTTGSIMLNAIRLVLSGGIYVPPCMTQHTHSHQGDSENNPVFTPRQLQVLKLLVKGDSNKVIAYKLELAEGTVKMHVTAILKHLGVTNRTQAAAAAEKMALHIS